MKNLLRVRTLLFIACLYVPLSQQECDAGVKGKTYLGVLSNGATLTIDFSPRANLCTAQLTGSTIFFQGQYFESGGTASLWRANFGIDGTANGIQVLGFTFVRFQITTQPPQPAFFGVLNEF